MDHSSADAVMHIFCFDYYSVHKIGGGPLGARELPIAEDNWWWSSVLELRGPHGLEEGKAARDSDVWHQVVSTAMLHRGLRQ